VLGRAAVKVAMGIQYSLLNVNIPVDAVNVFGMHIDTDSSSRIEPLNYRNSVEAFE